MELHLPYRLLIVSIVYSLLIGYFFNGSEENLILSAVLIIFGLALGLWAKRVIIKNKTTLNPSGNPTNLITARPFTFSRNPMYVSYVIVAVGVAIYSNHWAGFLGPILYFSYLNFITIPKEESKLKTIFPNDYPAYVSKVRRWL